MPRPEDTPLLLDAMLGKLSRYLRMCGYDVVYANDLGPDSDDALIRLAATESRLVVTRDESLAARSEGLLLESRAIVDQLGELDSAGFDLTLTVPSRCSRCNGELAPVAPTDSTPAYAPDPGGKRVWRCRRCDQYYWKGSHWEDVARTLDDV